MELTLSEIAKHLDGDVIGDSSCLISGVSEIQSAEPNTITFLGNPLYHKYLKNTNAAAILVADPSLLNGQNGILDRKSTRLNSSHSQQSRMPSSA